MKLAIKGHATRGKEVIQLLEMLGGKSNSNMNGYNDDLYYFIAKDGLIYGSDIEYEELNCKYTIFTLEEFLEKFPYKVGDKVTLDNKLCSIKWMCWECNNIYYQVQGIDTMFTKKVTTNDLQPYEEENYCQVIGNDTSSNGVNTSASSINEEPEPEPKAPILSNRYDYAEGKCGYVIPDGYEFDCIKNGFQNEIILKPKKPKHPTTSVESCEVLGYTVDDVIFTNDTGWIRITNKLWDCYAKEHVYEGIGIISGHEYKDIRHHNVTGKMQLGLLKHCKDVDDVRYVNSITDDIMINQITNKVSVIKFKPDVCDNKIELQLGDYEIEVRDGRTFAVKKKPKYPTTYDDCCDVLNIETNRIIEYDECFGYRDITQYDTNLLTQLKYFSRLRICRDAYWKIAGEEMGLDKPWKPDWDNLSTTHEFIKINKGCFTYSSRVLVFPTEEMRDAFYENFKDLINECKELL